MTIDLQYNNFPHKVKQEDGIKYIFDIIRKKWLVLTPEEWVRQNFLFYLIEQLGYSKSNIAVEKKITFHELTKRYDIVVFNTQGEPHMLVECKRQDTPLSFDVMQQALNYVRVVPAKYLVITNGDTALAWQILPKPFQIDFIPGA
jgi:hypothetical protein